MNKENHCWMNERKKEKLLEKERKKILEKRKKNEK